MTKVVKAWKRISFWNKLRGITTALGASGELAIYLTESERYQGVAIAATVVTVLITHLIEDKNNNGIVDLFEKIKPKNGPKTKEEKKKDC